jgi:hypothetical protein
MIDFSFKETPLNLKLICPYIVQEDNALSTKDFSYTVFNKNNIDFTIAEVFTEKN